VVEILPRDRNRFRKLRQEIKGADSLPIRTRLSDEEVARFAANAYRFPGVEIKARLFRSYPSARPRRTRSATSAASATATWSTSRRMA